MPRPCAPRSFGSSARCRGRAWALLLALLVPLVLPGSAAARRGISDGARAGLLKQVQPLLDRAASELSARDLVAAAKTLGSAYRAAPLPEVLLLLARLAQAEGRAVETYDLYRRYLADPTRVPDEAAAKEAETVLATPQPASGSLAVNGPPSALVQIDGRLVGVLPLPQPLLLAPGDHTLVLEVGGKRLDTPLQVAEGRLAEVRASRSSAALLISVLPALLVIDEWAGVAADSTRPLSDAIERAAIVQQLGVMPSAVALRQSAELRQCLGTLPCQQQLAKRSGLDYVLRSRVWRAAPLSPVSPVSAGPPAAPAAATPAAPTARWTFDLSLVHAEVSEPASTVQAACAACSAEQAAARYSEALTDLLTRGLPRQHGTAQITSTPAGATVSVGGRAIGPTPLRLPLWEGSYELSLALPGYKTAAQSLTIAAGAEAAASVELSGDEVAVKPTTQPDGRLPRPRWRLAVGGTLVSLAAVLLTVGGGDVAIDGGCAERTSATTECRRFFDTKPEGLVTAGIGLALGIAGGVMMAVPGPRQH